MTRYLVLSFVLSVFISSCTVVPALKPPQTDSNNQTIQQLLLNAELAMERNRLTTPADDNAIDRFRQVLLIEPTNDAAVDGINRIVERYLAWALDHAERANLTRARRFVALAEAIDPGHPNIQPVVNKINDQEDKVVRTFKLDTAAVRDQSIDPAQLERIAANIAHEQAFITIRAPDDRSGRWLYQELNRRVSFRIEASFETSSSASITLTL